MMDVILKIITRVKAATIFCIVALSYSGISQTLNLNQFGIEQGLPQSSIYTLLQDKQGNIWIGTMDGISRYNGVTFENFKKKDGLAENRVTASYLDKDGTIWLGHWSGGISKYDSAKKHFEEIIPEKIDINKKITCIFRDENGILWFGTDGQGLIKSENGNFSTITTANGLLANRINAIASYRNSSLLIATSNGVTEYKNNSFIPFSIPLPSNKVQALLSDSKGNFWIGTEDKGVFKINPGNKLIHYNIDKGLTNENVKIIFEDQQGNIYIGTYGGGVFKYLPHLETANSNIPLFQTISTQQGLSNDRILCIIQDREKNIWIGTYLNLNQYFDEQFEIYGSNEGLHNSLVWSVIQDRKGNFWIGTEGGIVQFIDNLASEVKGSKNEKSHYKFIRYTNHNDEVLNSNSLYEDINGNIWFSNFGHGLSRLNPASRKIDTYTKEKNNLPTNDIYSILGDASGNLWIGTNKGGLLKFDIKTEKFSRYTIKDGLGSDEIYTVFRDSKNRMWFGALGGELTMYDGNSFKRFNEKDGYPSKFTLCINEDRNGNLWMGTFDMGIYKYNGSSFKNYSTHDGLSSNTPFLLIPDDKNNLWIGTRLGVDRFDLKNETFKHYEKEDGFLGIEINPNAACKDIDGNLWFGSIIGLVKYNSKTEEINKIEPITTIKPPRIFFTNEEIPADHVFPWKKNHFTFDFIGTSLTNPKRVRYQYMLEGLDVEWSPVVKENSVTYPNLAPGKYTFKVKAANNDGIWNKEATSYSLIITPPFWKTTWFWSLTGIGLIIAIVFYIKYREQALRKKNMVLEQKVKERTEVINNQKVDLEKKNLNITDSIDYAKRIQQAVFISQKEINSFPFENFLLFKPKDIVSGDFYWAHKSKDDNYLFAIADCTGHGVPGAFMSIIGYNMINYVIKDLGMEKPAVILGTLKNLIQEILHCNVDDEKSMKDGLTMAIIYVDIKKMSLYFSGSYNPLYLIRNGELKEFKADRIPIGYSEENEHAPSSFTDYELPLKKGDLVYLFSDGYADQVGGPDRKKFYYPPFKKLLQSMSTLPMAEQKNKLDETIVNWINNKEQFDDITILGIKI